MAKKSCKKGYYYCYASKKCKKIPMGYVVGMGGWLRKEKEEDETEGKKKNGNGNGANGDGSGSGDSNGGSDGGGVSEGWSAKYKKSINCDNPKGFSQRAHCQGKKKVTEGKEGDHEVSMAKSQLKKSAENIAKLRKVLKKKTDKDNLPAWVQAKITDTEHNTDAAAGYMEEGKRDGKSAKDKGYSLRDWFKGGGWVQAGGKYDGKPCAKQPGQKTKPFCRDADDRANMSKKERSRRAAKKRREDPNPNRKGKAKMVTDNYSNWREDLKQLDEFMGLFGPKTVTPKDSPTGTKSVKVGKKYPARLDRKPVDVTYDKQGNKTVTPMSRGRAGLMQYKYGSTWGMPQYNSYELEGQVVEGRYSGGGGLRPTDRIKMGDGSLKSLKDIDAKLKEKNTKKEEVQMEGKKDACYHKVKSRYSVWPSAYASGALVKCRKVGAKNWGNKTNKESIDYNLNDEYIEENIIRAAKMTKHVIKALGKSRVRKKLPPINLKKLSPERRKEIMYQAQKRIKSYKPGEIDKSASRKYAADRLNTVYSRRQDILKKGGSPKEAAAQSISSMGPSDPLGKDFNIRRGGRGRRGAHGPQTDRGKGNKAARRSGQEVVDTGNIKVHYRPTRDQSIQRSRDKRAMRSMERRLNKTLNLNNSYEFSNWRDDFQAMEFESIDIIKAEPLKPTDGIGSRMLGEAKKCWKGYKKVGTQKLFGKTYNRCEKIKKEEVEIQEAIPGYEKYDSAMKSIRKKNLSGRKKIDALKAAAALRPKTEKEVMGEDWQKSNRKDGVDGMSQKSVDAYKRENPGSKLQTAVTEKKPTGKRAKRRKSFCSRSKGQKDMHNIDCTKTPDKKICKARKRWRC